MKINLPGFAPIPAGRNPPVAAERVVYRLDVADRIVYVDRRLRRERHPTDSHGPPPIRELGHSIWEYITHIGARELYRQIVADARAGRTFRFVFRREPEGENRSFEMVVAPWGTDKVDLRSSLRPAETAPAVESRFAHAITHGTAFIRMCGWCHALAAPAGPWLALEAGATELGLLRDEQSWRITHGVCPMCATKLAGALAIGLKSPSSAPAIRTDRGSAENTTR